MTTVRSFHLKTMGDVLVGNCHLLETTKMV